MLTSQEQVAAYMSGQLSVDTIGHRPPVPLSQMPWRDEINQQSAPTLVSRQASFSQDPITVEVTVTEDQYADFYYKHFGGTNEDTIGHQPPEPDNQMPWLDQLSEINQQTSLSLQGSDSGEQGCYYRDSG